jgi:hypothetical protein
MEEVIAFEEIPKASLDVSTSSRLGCQSRVDMSQMEKAMLNAQMRDVSSNTGKLLPPKYSIVIIYLKLFVRQVVWEYL